MVGVGDEGELFSFDLRRFGEFWPVLVASGSRIVAICGGDG